MKAKMTCDITFLNVKHFFMVWYLIIGGLGNLHDLVLMQFTVIICLFCILGICCT